MKMEFVLTSMYYNSKELDFEERVSGKIKLYPERGRTKKKLPPSVVIYPIGCSEYRMKDKDLERFAVNILKSLKSKRLK